MIGGLPPGSAVAVLVMALLPVATLVLHLVDRARNDGYVSVLGRR